MAVNNGDIKQPEPRDLGKTGLFDLTDDDDEKGFFTLEGLPEGDQFDRVSHSSAEVKEVSPRSNTPPVDFSASPYMQYQVQSKSNRGRNAITEQQSRSAASNMPAREQASETPSESYLITHSELLRAPRIFFFSRPTFSNVFFLRATRSRCNLVSVFFRGFHS